MRTIPDYEAERDAYSAAKLQRAATARMNTSRRMRGKEPLPLPPKPTAPKFPFAYCGNSWEGRITSWDYVPEGCEIRWELPNWA